MNPGPSRSKWAAKPLATTPARYRYVILNKPYRVLSQFTPEEPGQRTLAEFDLPKGLYAAGRLDSDSEGLLLLTDDGPLIKRLLEPAKGHERTYLVQVEGVPSPEALHQLEQGVVIQGYRTLPAKAKLLTTPPLVSEREPPIRVRLSISTSWITLTLREGKNRQVRRMTAAVGYPTLRLIRVSIGPLQLEGLEPGEWRYLDERKIESLCVGL